MTTIPFQTNFYNFGDNPARADALEGEQRADVVIVGGGIVGLSCAYTLRKEGLEVAVVERDHVGYSSSGRHLGHLTPHMWDMGSERPDRLTAWAQESLDVTEEMLSSEGVECDFHRVPYFMPAVHESDARSVRRAGEYYARLGLAARTIEAEKFDLVTFKTYGTLAIEKQGRADTYRLIRGMRDVILRMGVRLYEGTSVESVEGGAEVIVKTPGGSLRAPKVILALNAFSGQFPFLQKYVTPMHTYAIVTEPLGDEVAQTLGSPDCEELMIFDYSRKRDEPHFYQRFRSDRRFIFGGGGAELAPAPDRMAPDRNDKIFSRNHAEMIRRYPALEPVKIECGWGGPMCRTVNGLPILKDVPEHENVILAIIGNGNGVGLGMASGRLVKGLVLGRDSLDEDTRAFLEFCGGP